MKFSDKILIKITKTHFDYAVEKVSNWISPFLYFLPSKLINLFSGMSLVSAYFFDSGYSTAVWLAHFS